MRPDTAKAVVSDEFSRMACDGVTTSAEISYMGGEPLLNFPLIRDVSEWLWSCKREIPYELKIRTNGTLLTPEMKAWFVDNRARIGVGLSMDGLGEMNRHNRTDLRVDWDFFTDNWPSERVRMVLFRDSVRFLADTVREMNARGVPFKAVLGEGFEWDAEAAASLESQLLRLVPDYIDKPDEARDCGLFSFRIGDFFPAHPFTDIPLCGDSNNIIAYDVDGSPCVCHMFSTPSIGREKGRWAWDSLRVRGDARMDTYCADCPLQKNCKFCFGQNFLLYGDIRRNAAPATICNGTKAKARACSVLCLKRIETAIANHGELTPENLHDAELSLRLLETIPSFL